MKLWWYLEWPAKVTNYTLVYVKSNNDGKLVSINVLEYAALLINYAGAYHYYQENPDVTDPYPQVQFFVDSTSSEAWDEKGCTGSLIGRALSRL